jgi:hypothetical protein
MLRTLSPSKGYERDMYTADKACIPQPLQTCLPQTATAWSMAGRNLKRSALVAPLTTKLHANNRKHT